MGYTGNVFVLRWKYVGLSDPAQAEMRTRMLIAQLQRVDVEKMESHESLEHLLMMACAVPLQLVAHMQM
jgi:hypothetical protein